MPPVNVTVLGARGKLGTHLIKALVSPQFAASIGQIKAVGSSEFDIASLQTQKQDISSVAVQYEDLDSLTKAIAGTDLLINVNNFPASEVEASHHKKKNILEAAKAANVKVYVPSEFGVDWRTNDFKQIDWRGKKAHQLEARNLLPKVVGVYCGLFLESSFGFWYGWRFADYVLQPVGPPTTVYSYTSMQNVGLALASLAQKYAEQGAEALPDHMRLQGDSISAEDIKSIFEAADPEHKTLAIEPVPLEQFEKDMYSDPARLDKDPAEWIRLIKGRGKLDHREALSQSLKGSEGEPLAGGKEANREFVNPGESKWKWDTVKAYAEEVKGRPWL